MPASWVSYEALSVEGGTTQHPSSPHKISSCEGVLEREERGSEKKPQGRKWADNVNDSHSLAISGMDVFGPLACVVQLHLP